MVESSKQANFLNPKSSGVVEFDGEVYAVSPGWSDAKTRHRFEAKATEIPAEYAERLRRAQEIAELGEVSVSLETAKQLLIEALDKEIGNRLVVDEQNKPLFAALSAWIAYSPGDFDPKKGIALLGNVGAGKTVVLQALRRVLQVLRSRRAFLFNIASEVFAAVRGDADKIGAYKSVNRAFDDIGDEQTTVLDFGNRVEVFREILTDRHRVFMQHGIQTHLTSNLTPGEIEERYGTRVLDRLYEMCNIFTLSGPSRRK